MQYVEKQGYIHCRQIMNTWKIIKITEQIFFTTRATMISKTEVLLLHQSIYDFCFYCFIENSSNPNIVSFFNSNIESSMK